MANERVANALYVDTTTAQVDVEIRNIRIQGIMLNNASTPAAIELQIADYDASSPRVVLKLRISSSELGKYFDFSNSPINLPNGLSIPASGLTSGANATIIYKGNE